jgi:hypothetical protein
VALKKNERDVPIPIRRGWVVNLVVVPLGLVESLDSKFWGHDEAYESNHFLEQRKRRMTTTPLASIGNKSTKVKRPKKGGFCFVFFFGFCFVLSPFFLFMFLSSSKSFLSPRMWLLLTT